MYVVYVYDIRADLLDLPDELFCRSGRGQTVTVQHPGLDAVPAGAPRIAHGNELRQAGGVAAIPSLGVCNAASPAVTHRQFADLLHDAARRGGDPHHGVDLKQCFHARVIDANRRDHRPMTASSA